MKKPKISALYPAEVFLKAGTLYQWCSCGQSSKEPFCDGDSHTGTAFEPIPYQVIKSKTVFFCLCKHTENPPICDGHHNKLTLES